MIDFSVHAAIFCDHPSCPARFDHRYTPAGDVVIDDLRIELRKVAVGAGWVSLPGESESSIEDLCPEHKPKGASVAS